MTLRLQPYRYARPHNPAACIHCAPDRPGHFLCQHPGCDELSTAQVQRHATAEEYDALPDGHKPIDGVAMKAVYACDEHGEDIEPFCEHPVPEPVPCPRCDATGPQPCLTKKGKRKGGHHRARIDVQPPPPTVCRHAHRPDCAVFEGCQCSHDDPLPERPKRIVAPAPPPGPAPILLPVHGELRALLEAHGVDVARILRTELIPNGDGTSAMLLTVTMVVRQPNGDLSYDEHGYPRTEVLVIELQIPRATDRVTPELLARPDHRPAPGQIHATASLS